MNKSRIPLIVSIVFLLGLSACKKEPLEKLKDIRPNPAFLTQPQNVSSTTVNDSTVFKRVLFHDDFTSHEVEPGKGAQENCYNIKPKCLIRGDWFQLGDCPDYVANLPGLKNLNKCVWEPWHMAQNNNKDVVNLADAIDVSYSSDVGHNTLKLKIMKNPYYDPSKGACGTTDASQVGNVNTNCKLMVGSVDSNYFDPTYHGYNALYGRIEMKVRFITTTTHAGYPALWLWPEKIGTGYPLTANSAEQNPHVGGWSEPKHIGEIDILESNGDSDKNYIFQSYHQWDAGNINAYISQGRTLTLSQWHTIGVEWDREPGDYGNAKAYIKFYNDNGYVYQINRGDKSDHGDHGVPMAISDTASFIRLSFGTAGGNDIIDPQNGDIFEISEVTVYGR